MLSGGGRFKVVEAAIEGGEDGSRSWWWLGVRFGGSEERFVRLS